jgi:hypothetical protein
MLRVGGATAQLFVPRFPGTLQKRNAAAESGTRLSDEVKAEYVLTRIAACLDGLRSMPSLRKQNMQYNA